MIDWRREFAKLNLDVVFRIDDPELWVETYDRLVFRPSHYSDASLDYQLAYQRGHGCELIELSCVLHSSSKPVAIWPLSIPEDKGNPSLTSQGLPVMPPIFVADCRAKTRKKITSQCLQLANRFAYQLKLNKWWSKCTFAHQSQIIDWQLLAMAYEARCEVQHELYVDLSLTLPEIKSSFRKSFRPLVTSGQRLWHIEILSAPGDVSVWEEFQRLHVEAAGRVTRSSESWQLQHAMIIDDQAFLVVLRDGGGHMVGGGFFTCSADEGAYAVGAYNRNFFDKPLGHVVQYKAIEELKRRGCVWYYIGRRCFPGDSPAPNTKELSIATFKQGFASHVLPSFLLTHKVEVCVA
jgi:FemAB family protein